MGALSYWTFRVYLLSIYNKFSEKMVLGENQVEVGRQDKVQEESRVGGVQKVNYKVQELNSKVNYYISSKKSKQSL